MSEFQLILRLTLIYGAVLSVALSALIVGSLRYNAEMWLNDYPRDIQKKYGAIGRAARRQRVVGGILFVVIVVAVVVAVISDFWRSNDGNFGFLSLSVLLFLVFTFFNLVDLLLLDWLLFVAIQPRWVILPGTEGMKGYRDWWFHVRAFLMGLALTAMIAPLIAASVTVIRWLMS